VALEHSVQLAVVWVEVQAGLATQVLRVAPAVVDTEKAPVQVRHTLELEQVAQLAVVWA